MTKKITQLIAIEMKKIENGKVSKIKPKWSHIVEQEIDSCFIEITSNIDLVQKSVI